MMPIVSFDNVRYSYGEGVAALDGVTFDIDVGEFVCVLGANGSGKSTLARHMNALLVPSEGHVCVAGCDTADASGAYDVRSSVGMVFQNPDDQLVASIVEDEVAFAPENLGLPPDEIRMRVTRALHDVGLQGLEKRDVSTLSGGQKQRLAIAGALAMKPQVLVLDEATAMLDPRGRAGVLKLCHALNDEGLTIVMITHFIDEAAEASRVLVLDRGCVVADGSPAEVLADAEALVNWSLEPPFSVRLACALNKRGVSVAPTIDIHELCGDIKRGLPMARCAEEGEWQSAQIAQEDAGQMPSTPMVKQEGAKAVLEFRGVSFAYPNMRRGRRFRKGSGGRDGQEDVQPKALSDISFAIGKGDFFGVAGHTGSGKSTLMQLCNGLLQPTSGSVLWNGKDLGDKREARRARCDVGLVFQYPEHQLFAATVFDDVAFGPRNLGWGEEEVKRAVIDALRLVHLDIGELRERSPFALSGGQQRRVAFAGVLAMRPSVLVLDEPAAGLDPCIKAQFMGLIKELHDERGMTIVIVSHDMDDLAALCNRMLVLNEGSLFSIGEPSSVFSDERSLKRIGLDVPREYGVVRSLGIHHPSRIPVSIESLADAIAQIVNGT